MECGVGLSFRPIASLDPNSGLACCLAEYVAHAHLLGRAGFSAALDAYRQERPKGDKEHRRHTDILAGGISAQKLYGVPVGLMFFEGSSRLLKAGVTVPHLHYGDPLRLAVEAYPGKWPDACLAAPTTRRTTSTNKRRTIFKYVATCSSGCERLHEHYGSTLHASDGLSVDPTGDHLDALICAAQAAWAWASRRGAFGAPTDIDLLEGCIAEPTLSHASW